MITREYVEKVISSVVDAADYAEFQKHVADDFIYEFMGTQPYSGEWRGPDAVKRQFTAFNENFTTDFRVKVTELYVDAKKNTLLRDCNRFHSPIWVAETTGSIACGSLTSTITVRLEDW